MLTNSLNRAIKLNYVQIVCFYVSNYLFNRLSSDESDSEGTIYTFSRADSAVVRGSSGNDQSETECEKEKIARLGRGTIIAVSFK